MPSMAHEPIAFDSEHLNETVLRHWGYTFYEGNKTLSNDSSCYIAFGRYTPHYFSNGTFVNSTSCYDPINPIKTRGILAVVFGSLFALTILFTTVNLRKHGKSYLAREKRWRSVGRRWQWYWMLFVAACGMASTFTAVDVDRIYVLSLPMSLQCFFLTLMTPGLNAAVWEGVRHWGSFQQQLIREGDAFALKDDDLRSRIELHIPLIFYVFDWLVFFMTIPRPWTTVQKQRSVEQARLVARPAATDTRFKAGAILSACCLILICFSLLHSKLCYRASLRKTILPSIVFTLACRIGYFAAASWMWDLSPYNLETDLGFLYSLNYLPALSILVQFNIRGYLRDNDDTLLIAERAARGQVSDVHLELRHGPVKPSWWSHSSRGRDRAQVRSKPCGEDIEMTSFSRPGTYARRIEEDESGTWWWQRQKQDKQEAEGKDSEDAAEGSYRPKGSSLLRQEEPPLRRRTSQTRSEGSVSNYSTVDAKPQAVRSMLDI